MYRRHVYRISHVSACCITSHIAYVHACLSHPTCVCKRYHITHAHPCTSRKKIGRTHSRARTHTLSHWQWGLLKTRVPTRTHIQTHTHTHLPSLDAASEVGNRVEQRSTKKAPDCAQTHTHAHTCSVWQRGHLATVTMGFWNSRKFVIA